MKSIKGRLGNATRCSSLTVHQVAQPCSANSVGSEGNTIMMQRFSFMGNTERKEKYLTVQKVSISKYC
jgi:hypothetical protein